MRIFLGVEVILIELVCRRIGANLRVARKEKYPNDDQKTFGSRIGVSRETVSKMERGDLGVSFESYLKAAYILDCLDPFNSLFEVKQNLLKGDW